MPERCRATHRAFTTDGILAAEIKVKPPRTIIVATALCPMTRAEERKFFDWCGYTVVQIEDDCGFAPLV